MRASIVVVALALAGCGKEPGRQAPVPPPPAASATAEERAAETARILGLAAQGGVSVRPGVAGDATFAKAVEGDDAAVKAIGALVAPAWDPAEAAAAAMGLGSSKSDAAEAVLVRIALLPSHPPEALEALFSYYRWRGADKPAPATLPDPAFLAYEKHPTPRGRAALAHLGRSIKDPALIPVLERLAKDPDFEVRRAVAISLADGPPKTPRAKADADRCLAALPALLADADAHVVAAACRGVSSYDDPKAAALLMPLMSHADFNVRVAALEGLGKRKAKDAALAMAELAKTDAWESVRYAAAEQLAEIDADLAQTLVDGLLADPSEYVRCAGVDLLAKSTDLTAAPRLATLASSDPHVRVRETAVGAFEGKKDSGIAKDAIRAALADKDAGVVSTACGVVAKNEWKDLVDVLLAVPARFPGCPGADAREAALSALSDLDGATYLPLFEVSRSDPNPAVRAAAEKAIAKAAKKDPAPPSRGADLTGDLLPGGAPIFSKDVFLHVQTDQGMMKIRLFPDQAPVHCAHVAALARKGFYDGLSWHRVVPDFVIQGGCPRGDGSGNAGVTLPLEPTRVPFERGTLGMPRSDAADTGGCQLFVCHSRAPHLDVHYTAFGKVVEGLDVIDKIDVDSKIVRITVEGAR